MGGSRKSKEWSRTGKRGVGVHQAEDGQFGQRGGQKQNLAAGKGK